MFSFVSQIRVTSDEYQNSVGKTASKLL